MSFLRAQVPHSLLVLHRGRKMENLGGTRGGLLGDFFSGSPKGKTPLFLTFIGYWGDLGDFTLLLGGL